MTQKRSKSKIYWSLLVLLALAGGAYGFYRWKKQEKQAPTYREVPVARGDLQITILTTGIVQPQNRLEIKPPIPGRVEKVLVQEGDRVRKGQIVAWMSSTERAALLDSARSKGADEVARWEQIYRPTPIIAPITGTIILKSVEPGQTFTSVESVLTISDRLTVKAQVDETDISQVKEGQKAQIVLDAYASKPLAARAERIAYDAKKDNNNVTTYIVDVVPKETPDFMRSGMTANVSFYVDERKNALLVPSEAVQIENGVSRVLIKNPDPKGAPLDRDVKVGISDGKQSEVLDGLQEGEIVQIPEVILSNGDKPGSPFSPFGGGRPRKKN